MAKTMMLSLDLEGHVSEDSRKKVYAKLAELHWIKVPQLTTVWRCSFKEPQAESAIIEVAKSDVTAAAAAGAVSRYHAVVLAGESTPTEFSN